MNILYKIQHWFESLQNATSEKIYLTGVSGSFTTMVVSFNINFDIAVLFKILTAVGGLFLTWISIYLQLQQKTKNDLEIKNLELQNKLTEWQMRQTNSHFTRPPFDLEEGKENEKE